MNKSVIPLTEGGMRRYAAELRRNGFTVESENDDRVVAYSEANTFTVGLGLGGLMAHSKIVIERHGDMMVSRQTANPWPMASLTALFAAQIARTLTHNLWIDFGAALAAGAIYVVVAAVTDRRDSETLDYTKPETLERIRAEALERRSRRLK